jgi:hypothetical protein
MRWSRVDIQFRRVMLRRLSAAAVCCFWAANAPLSALAAELRAGAAASNITPWLGVSINGGFQDQRATGVHDELYARALVLDDGRTRLAVVVVDSCMLPRGVIDEAKRRIQESSAIAPERVLVSATHTHSAAASAAILQSEPDPAYPPFLARRISDAVRRAVNLLRPARIGWGVGKVPEHVFNRRWRMKPGTVPLNPFGGTDVVKMNPPAGSPDLVGPAGPTDPDLTVVSVQEPDGRPIALLGNYSLHYVGGVRRGEISADYYGMFAERIRDLVGAERMDPPFVGILSNGTSGDVNNVNFREPRPAQAPYEQMRRVADRVAEEALRVWRTIEHRGTVELDARVREIELGVRKAPPAELGRAREILARAGNPPYQAQEAIYAREAVLLADFPDRVPVRLQALRIGDLAIAAIPAEVFAAIGLEIKERSPFRPTFTISLANGYHGYLPAAGDHRLGGYETWRARSSYLEVDAAGKIVGAVLGLLAALKSP